MNEIVNMRRQNLETAKKEIQFLKEEFAKFGKMGHPAFNRQVKSDRRLSELGAKYFKNFDTRFYSGLFMRINKYELISCGNPECLNIATTLKPSCSVGCVNQNLEVRAKREANRTEKLNDIPIWYAEPFVLLNDILDENLSPSQQNLAIAQAEVDYLKKEFSRVDSKLTKEEFNQIVKSNIELSNFATKYLKIYYVTTYSRLFARIKEFDLTLCGNQKCLNVASKFKPECSVACGAKNRQFVYDVNPSELFTKYVPYTTTDSFNPRQTNLITAQHELSFITEEFTKIELIAKCGESFNQIVKSNDELAKLAAKYFKIFRTHGYSGLFSRIKKYDLIMCGNPDCEIVVSEIKKCCSPQCIGKYPLAHENRKLTNLNKYGVENVFQADEIRAKMKITNMERHGHEYSIRSNSAQSKVKATNMERYGTECIGSVKSIQDKIRKTAILNRWDSLAANSLIKVLTSKEEFKSGAELKIECKSCNALLEYPQLRCFDCHPPKTNFEQNEVRDYITSLGFEVIENDRTSIGKEIDILIPSKKIGIEYNGIYWHSEKMKKSVDYHANKTMLATKAGYKLIHIFSDQWKNRQEIVKKRLRHMLGLETRTVYARKCKVEEISSPAAKDFLNINHIQGPGNARIKLALKYKGEIVAVMTFAKPRFNKNYDYEMIRFATSCNVPGGASKLLAAFKKLVPSASIITYADKSWSDGALYRTLGFTELKDSAPNYFWTNEKETYKRYETMKHKLPKLLKNFDSTLSESANMMRNGFLKIHDCGNKVFELKY